MRTLWKAAILGSLVSFALALSSGCDVVEELLQDAQEILAKNAEIGKEYLEQFPYIQQFGGAGSKYKALLKKDGTVEITVDGTTSTGTYKRLKTGFLQVTIEGQTTYGLVIPGFTMVLKDTSSDKLVPMVYTGSCPSQGYTANWILVHATNEWKSDSADWPYFGAFTGGSNGTLQLDSQYALAAPSTNMGSSTLGEASCSNGFATITGTGDKFKTINAWQTTLGGGVLHIDPDTDNEMVVLALPQEELNAAPSGRYAGIFYQDGSSSTVVLDVDSNGNGTGYQLTDYTDPNSKADPVSISFGDLNTPHKGMVLGTIEGSSQLACLVKANAANTGRAIAFCVAQDDNGTHGNAFLVQQPTIQ